MPHASLSRRQLFRYASLSSAGLAAASLVSSERFAAVLEAQEKGNGKGPKLAPLNRFPRMVQEWYVDQVRGIDGQIRQRLAALKTKEDAENYVRSVQERIRQSFGPEPERSPLKPQITGTLQRDGYRIEKVIFESRPNFPVTANLYVPTNRQGRMPGVVGSCGHSSNGKAEKAYQSFSQGLARQGYVVLIYDPIGQGERLQYTDENFKPRHGVGVSEHLLVGNQQTLVGEHLCSWRAWDGIRALDYLLTRDEVDPKHVGITGNSGGGTMTTWLCGVERRWTMAAPSCFVTTFRRNLENELPADTEQCPPSVLALGLDHADFLAAMAPKPVIILAKERDFFDVRGSIEAYERLKHLYTLLGAPNNVQLFIGPTTHGYTQENREAMYGFFNRVTGASEGSTEPELTIEKDEDLWCTPHGQVAEMKPATVVSFTAARSKELAKQRKPLEGRALQEAIIEVLRLPEIAPPVPDYRILRPIRSRQYGRRFATQYAVETEPGIQALVARLSDESHVSRPPHDPRPATLYVSHHSADAELRDEPFAAKLLEAAGDGPFYACDVRGIGESKPDTCGTETFLTPYGSDYFYSAHGLMLDRPYVGQKTYDLVCVLKWLRSLGHREVHLAAKGWGAIPAAFAAVLAEGVASVQLHQGLQSYTVVAESEDYKWPFSTLAPGILARFDLPDCYRALSRENKLKLSDMQGAVPSFESKTS